MRNWGVPLVVAIVGVITAAIIPGVDWKPERSADVPAGSDPVGPGLGLKPYDEGVVDRLNGIERKQPTLCELVDAAYCRSPGTPKATSSADAEKASESDTW